MSDYQELFNDSYERTVQSDPDAFFDRFYEIFLAANPRVAVAFAKTNMARQREMLMDSMAYVIDFSITMVPSEYLSKVARRHGKKDLNIEPYLYDIWIESLLTTLRERDKEFLPETETSWRVLLAPGIAFMKSNYIE